MSGLTHGRPFCPLIISIIQAEVIRRGHLYRSSSCTYEDAVDQLATIPSAPNCLTFADLEVCAWSTCMINDYVVTSVVSRKRAPSPTDHLTIPSLYGWVCLKGFTSLPDNVRTVCCCIFSRCPCVQHTGKIQMTINSIYAKPWQDWRRATHWCDICICIHTLLLVSLKCFDLFLIPAEADSRFHTGHFPIRCRLSNRFCYDYWQR